MCVSQRIRVNEIYRCLPLALHHCGSRGGTTATRYHNASDVYLCGRSNHHLWWKRAQGLINFWAAVCDKEEGDREREYAKYLSVRII